MYCKSCKTLYTGVLSSLASHIESGNCVVCKTPDIIGDRDGRGKKVKTHICMYNTAYNTQEELTVFIENVFKRTCSRYGYIDERGDKDNA